MWNPNAELLGACRESGHEFEVFERDKSSIPSLRWYGEDSEDVRWVLNEKYAWC